MRVDEREFQAIGLLWGELTEFPAGDVAGAREHCFAELARIIGSENVFWVAAHQAAPDAGDLLDGWRPRAVARLHSNPALDQKLADVIRQMNGATVDPMTLANNREAGRTRAFLRGELVADETWERSALVNETLRPRGVRDRIIATLPLPGGREAHIGLDRGPSDRFFGERERDLLHLFLLGSQAFHHEQFLAYGVALPALTPRERAVLSLLLTEMTEREIGEALGLTWRSTHQYCVSIFRKCGVRGRLGLMALWLRNPGARPPAT
ncbi:helix-turn-helix transcriptional regulator [Caulobacter sp.]|uniref:helix-turn-helix transcriptional regulator n=1 Tax=Caulobacter sp. TaxID=78 RepID=UPI001B23AE4E|nr:helix-turn-helix transcriptional regulator [Caulobacter sp.]MBO9547003.1 helix-turn-helix transcriptional regulator [Caulobacter sp.]